MSSRRDILIAEQRWYTLGGFVAIVLWSTTVALARSLSEQLGPLTGAAAAYGVGGVIALVRLCVDARRRRRPLDLPLRYVVGCGLLFVVYAVLLFMAIGLAHGRQQVLEVGLLNYLWPALTVLLSVWVLNNRARFWLYPATVLAMLGVVLVLTHGADVSWTSFCRNVASNPAAYGLALCAAVCWALYSVLARHWAGGERSGAVDLFLTLAGCVLLFACLLVDEPREWHVRTLAEALFLGAATYVAYGLWDAAMRRGNVMPVAAGSYLTPLLSTLLSCLYLGVAPQPRLWLGCGLLVTGSLLSWLAAKRQ